VAGGATRSRSLATILCALAASCATAPEVTVLAQKPGAIRPPAAPGLLGLEDALTRGLYPEVERYLASLPRGTVEKSPSLSALAGKASLARGDFEAAWPVLERARALESRPARRAEIEWALSQGAILWNDFASARDYASSAIQDGYGLVPGFLRFLDALADVDVYAGPPVGEEHETAFHAGGFDLVRIPVQVNSVSSAAIVDSGAVYTILTESFARQAGVREIPESRASGRGLHKKEFPVTFGIVDRLEFAGFSVRDVPVMLMPDEALLFETSRGQFPVPAVLGAHLLKEFSMRIDYPKRRLSLRREDFRVAKRDAEQNLFFYRGRVFARCAINGVGFYQFLLDTGSEPTMMTSVGLARAGLPSSNKLFRKKVIGLGKTQAEWGRVREVTIGVAGSAARFRDLIVRDDEGTFEDGIIGNSFLGHFRVRVDFSRMVLMLESEN
jgi:predicted aspartyl protease